RQRHALLEVVLMGEDAPFGPASGAGRVYDAGHVLAVARNELGLRLTPECFPTEGAGKVRVWRSLGDQHCSHAQVSKPLGLRDGAPEEMLHNQEFGLAVRQQLKVLTGRELEVERYKHATRIEDGVGR